MVACCPCPAFLRNCTRLHELSHALYQHDIWTREFWRTRDTAAGPRAVPEIGVVAGALRTRLVCCPCHDFLRSCTRLQELSNALYHPDILTWEFWRRRDTAAGPTAVPELGVVAGALRTRRVRRASARHAVLQPSVVAGALRTHFAASPSDCLSAFWAPVPTFDCASERRARS